MSTLGQLCDRDGVQETFIAKEGSMTFLLPSDASNVGIFDNVMLDAVVVAIIIGGRSKRWWYILWNMDRHRQGASPDMTDSVTPHLRSTFGGTRF